MRNKYDLLYAALELLSQNAARGYVTPKTTLGKLKRLILQAPNLSFEDVRERLRPIYSELLEAKQRQQKQRFNMLVRAVLKQE